MKEIPAIITRHREEGDGVVGEARMWRKCQKTLPRSHPVYHLYEYRSPEYSRQSARLSLL